MIRVRTRSHSGDCTLSILHSWDWKSKGQGVALQKIAQECRGWRYHLALPLATLAKALTIAATREARALTGHDPATLMQAR